MKIFCLGVSIILFSGVGCGFNAVVFDLPQIGNEESGGRARGTPDFSTSETVTVNTPSGVISITGSVGEIVHKSKSANGATIEGTFYE